jgi:hypothetical protein
MTAKLTVQYSAPSSPAFTQELEARLLRLSILNCCNPTWTPVSGQRWTFQIQLIDRQCAEELRNFLENLSNLHQRPLIFVKIDDVV